MKVSPSVLTADFTNLASEIKKIESADFIHLDIMDGHFVPNISFGPAISKEIAKMSNLPLDIHLMVSKPLMWIDQFVFKTTEYITVHFEAEDFLEAVEKIHENKVLAGVSIKPNTKAEDLLLYLDNIDLVLVMTVEPGFGGQKFMADMLEKVKLLASYRKEHNLNFIIEVDGGISDKNIALCRESGIDMVVAGSYIFNQEDAKKGIDSLR